MKVRVKVLDKVQRRRRRRRLAIFGPLVVIIVFLLAAFGWFVWSDNFSIDRVEVVGARAINPGAIKAETKSVLANKYLKLIPKEHSILFPRAELETALRQVSPRLKTVKFSREGWHVLIIEVSERAPAAIVCSQACYFVDDGGFIFSSAPNFSIPMFLVWQIGTTTKLEIGGQAAKSQDFKQVSETARLVSEVLSAGGAKWQPDTVSFFNAVSDGDYRLALINNSAAAELPVIININQSATATAHNLDIALGYLLGSSTPRSLPSLKYIDLRFGKKVFYKL